MPWLAGYANRRSIQLITASLLLLALSSHVFNRGAELVEPHRLLQRELVPTLGAGNQILSGVGAARQLDFGLIRSMISK
jgi:hypothetical protein